MLAAATAGIALSCASHAQPANVGDIHGRVFNVSSGTYLTNARVSVPGTGIEAFTDSSGEYRLSRLPPGDVTVVVAYTGLSSQSATIKVEAGKTLRHDFDLDARDAAQAQVVMLDPFSVEASRLNAQSLALNEQRYSPNIRNVVAAGEFGDDGEGSVTELLRYLPGVNVDVSTAGQGVSIRGMPSDTTLVTIDGAELASVASFGTGRNIEVNSLRLNNISRAEITKVPTPDLPASSLGGTINVISKSGFERKTPLFTYRGYLTANLRTYGEPGSRPDLEPSRFGQSGFNVSYERPVNESFAFNFSSGASRRSGTAVGAYTRSGFTTWDLNNLVLLSQQSFVGERVVTSADATLGVEWRMGQHNSLRASFLYFDMTHLGDDHGATQNFGAGATGDENFVQGAASGVGSATIINLAFKRNEKTRHFNLMDTYKRGPWKIDVAGSISKNYAYYRDIDAGIFGVTDLRITNLVLRSEQFYKTLPPMAHGAVVTATDRAGQPVDVFDLGEYTLFSVRKNYHWDNTDTKTSLRANVVREFSDGFSLQAGVAMNRQERDLKRDFAIYNFRPGTSEEVRKLKHYDLIDRSFNEGVKSYYPGQPQPVGPSQPKLFKLFNEHPEYFAINEANAHQTNVQASKFLRETISAAYIRGDLKNLFGNRLWLVGGVRFEKTATDGRGPLVDRAAHLLRDQNGQLARSPTGAFIPVTTDALERNRMQFQERAVRVKRSYDGFYPSLNATYRFSEDFLLRAGYARTIGRPRLVEIMPSTTMPDAAAAESGADRVIRVVNTGLLPWESDSYDLTFESYKSKLGVGSIGVFAKNIKNFFGAVQTPATSQLLAELNIPEEHPGEFSDYDIITKENVGSAKVRGVEGTYRQSLFFLPGWGKNIQLHGSATMLHLTGPNTADFTGYVSKILSWGVNYARGKFSIRANWIERGRNRTALLATSATIPENTYQYIAPRMSVSGDIQYQFSPRFALILTAADVTDTRLVTERYNPTTPSFAKAQRVQIQGASFTLGVKGQF